MVSFGDLKEGIKQLKVVEVLKRVVPRLYG
jgi:hypothetical protein